MACPQAWLDAVHPEDRERAQRASLTDQSSGAYDIEYRIVRPDGETRWIRDRAFPVEDETGDVYRIVGVARDITASKHAHGAMRSLVREKEALLKEVHHRVKNNLQVILSLLRLEDRRSIEPGARTVLKVMQGRILSMAVLHEMLYRTGDFGRIDLASYLKKLAEQFLRSQSLAAGEVRLDLHTSPVYLAIDQAVPCGLIVNEMLTNSLKHGFAEGKGGAVSLELGTLADGQVRMVLADSGVGLPSDFEARRARSLGLQLISDLARQLGGCLDIGPGPAARFAVTFPAATRQPTGPMR